MLADKDGNRVGTPGAAQGRVAVGGIPAEHPGAVGIEGVVGAIDTIMEGLDWGEGRVCLDLIVVRDPDSGETRIKMYDILSISEAFLADEEG